MQRLLDTCVLSEIQKGKNPHVAQKAQAYLSQYKQFTFSLMTRYEILRGLKDKKAPTQLVHFERLSRKSQILPLDEDIIVLAADLWVALKQAGKLIGDNDLFIAATALHHGLILVTRNVAHFGRIPGLTLEDWTKP